MTADRPHPLPRGVTDAERRRCRHCGGGYAEDEHGGRTHDDADQDEHHHPAGDAEHEAAIPAAETNLRRACDAVDNQRGQA